MSIEAELARLEARVREIAESVSRDDGFVSLNAYAEKSGCELKALRRAAKAEEFATYRPAKRLLARRSDLDAWVARHRVEKVPDTVSVSTETDEFERALRRAS